MEKTEVTNFISSIKKTPHISRGNQNHKSTVQGEKVYGLAAGYVAIPTTKPISELKSKGTATYKACYYQ